MKLEGFYITGLSTVTPLGASRAEIRESLERNEPRVTTRSNLPVFSITAQGEAKVERLRETARYKKLDRVTHVALAAAEETFSGEFPQDICGVSIGSSRGAAAALERSIAAFNADPTTLLPNETSPVTTGGSVSSWVGQLLLDSGGGGSQVEHPLYLGTSMTCSSAFQSLIVGLGMLRGGFGSSWVFGGSESCITDYVLSHFLSLRLYGKSDSRYPSQPCLRVSARENAVALGEASGVAFLTTDRTRLTPDDLELVGIGWATERIPSSSGISADGALFEASMRAAIDGFSSEMGSRIATLILHSPGSVRGDRAELQAVRRVFGEGLPVWSSKYLTGHSYGASPMTSLAAAREALTGVTLSPPEYPNSMAPVRLTEGDIALLNCAGFGGTSVTVAVRRATA